MVSEDLFTPIGYFKTLLKSMPIWSTIING